MRLDTAATPTPFELIATESDITAAEEQTSGIVNFETGSLVPGEIEALLNTLPLEIAYIDSTDTVRYFNHSQERLFIRTKAVINRKVQQCHPQKKRPPS